MGFIDTLKHKYQTGNLAIKLIFINVGIYLLVMLVENLFKFPLSSWLGLNSNFEIFLRKPWSIISYMFLHLRPFHLLFNMIMLYVIGDFFYRYFGDKAFAKFYFIGGLCGGLVFLLMDFFLSGNSLLMGASAAIYSVLFAMVAYQPELRVRVLFIQEPIKLLHVVIGFLALGFILNANNFGGNISHVGGALFGYFYMKQFEKGKSFLDTFKNPFSNLRKKSPLKATKNKTTKTPPRDDYEYADWKKANEDKTNRILEKISRSGYNSLSKEEKEFLFNQGKGKK